MPKIRIVGSVDDDLREALMKLLDDAGCEVLDDLPVDAIEEDAEQYLLEDDAEETEEEQSLPVEGAPVSEFSHKCDEDAGIVVLSPKCLADGGLEKAMQGAAARGCHVVGVWPPGTVAQDLPRPFEDYGGDTVVWHPGRLRDLLSQPEAQPTWPLPDNQPRPDRPLKRNKC